MSLLSFEKANDAAVISINRGGVFNENVANVNIYFVKIVNNLTLTLLIVYI